MLNIDIYISNANGAHKTNQKYADLTSYCPGTLNHSFCIACSNNNTNRQIETFLVYDLATFIVRSHFGCCFKIM